MTKVTVRCSTLSGYTDCPRRSAARMIWPELKDAGFTMRQMPHGVGAAAGTSVHTGAATTLQTKMDSGALGSADDAIQAAVQEFRELAAQGIQYDGELGGKRDAEAQIVRMVRAFFVAFAPSIDPVAVEERLEADYSDLIKISGQADWLCRTPDAVDDLKTGARRGHHKPQLGGYSLIFRAHGFQIDQARECFIARVSPLKPQPEPESHDHNVVDCETAAINVLRHIEGDIRTFRDGDPARGVQPGDPWAFMANPSSNLCSERWCPAHGTQFCREWRDN